jgi:hypothetical protein
MCVRVGTWQRTTSEVLVLPLASFPHDKLMEVNNNDSDYTKKSRRGNGCDQTNKIYYNTLISTPTQVLLNN